MRADLRSPQLSVVIPAYNERARIAATMADLVRVLPSIVRDWEIRIVDDGSTDGTLDVARRAAAGDPRLVIQAEPHRGKGGAVRAGMLAARGRLRFMCDADLSMRPHELPSFLALVPDRCDVAIASRELAGARRVGEPRHRHWMGRLFNWLVRTTTLPGLQDTQCGFKLFTAQAVEAVFPKVQTEGWAFDIEVLAVARRLGLSIDEVPIEWHYGAESRISPIRDAIGMTRELFAIRRRVRAIDRDA
ncbi:MAG TPA: dolichyl-phosphate beta-glucosyltransferase [Vicinamibacterales bacterium]|nr:dolichyl-phosphate beta-glucosyltransferase [Vicinamibacterales bacterium]